MTRQEYADYQERVARYLKGIEYVSTGTCEGCEDCAEDTTGEPWFSNSPCEVCHGCAGNRVPWHGVSDDKIIHGSCCEDCEYYLNYGRLDDTTMAAMEGDG